MNSSQHLGVVIRTSGPRDAKGTKVFNATLKCTRRWGDKSFDTYVDCDFWGAQAEQAADQLGEGVTAWVFGEPGARAYKGKDGEPKSSLTCRANSFGVVGEQSSPSPKQPRPPRKSPPQQGGKYEPIAEDDIPF